MFRWPVVPICDKQKRDIHPDDLRHNGLYRLCDIYRAGNGMDKFTNIAIKHGYSNVSNTHFVVQLYGCPMQCFYCYVTPEGIWGKPVHKTSGQLASDWASAYRIIDDLYAGSIFHLMGGAPALYLPYWKDLIVILETYLSPSNLVFHSDFLLTEMVYQKEWLYDLHGLFAVSIKHFHDYTKEEWKNMELLRECGVDFYVTFTGDCQRQKDIMYRRYGNSFFEDSFDIEIIKYKALER